MSAPDANAPCMIFKLPNELLCFIYDGLLRFREPKVTPEGELLEKSCDDIVRLRSVSRRMRAVGEPYFAKVVTNRAFILTTEDIKILTRIGSSRTLVPHIHTLRFNPTVPYYGVYEEADRNEIPISDEVRAREWEYNTECHLFESLRHWDVDHSGYSGNWTKSISFIVAILFPFTELKYVDLASWGDYIPRQLLYMDFAFTSSLGNTCMKELQSRTFFLHIFQAALNCISLRLQFLRVGEMSNIYPPGPHFPLPVPNLVLRNLRHLEIGFKAVHPTEYPVFTDPRVAQYMTGLDSLESLMLVCHLIPPQLQRGLHSFFNTPFPKLKHLKLALQYTNAEFKTYDWYNYILPALKKNANTLRLVILDITDENFTSLNWVALLRSIYNHMKLDQLRIRYPFRNIIMALRLMNQAVPMIAVAPSAQPAPKEMATVPAAKRLIYYFDGDEMMESLEFRPGVKWGPMFQSGTEYENLPYLTTK